MIINFLGTQVYAYLEAMSKQRLPLQISIDGQKLSKLKITDIGKLYPLTAKPLIYARHELILQVSKGVRIYSVNFPSK